MKRSLDSEKEVFGGPLLIGNMVNEDHDDHTSVITGTTTDPGFIPLEMFDYEIAKWMANTELKRQKKGVEEEMERHERLQLLSQATPFGEMSDYVLGGANLQRENQSLLIDEYWSPVAIDVKYKGLSKEQIRGVLILQNAFRTWIILKRYRQILKSRASAGSRSFGDVKSVATALYIQASVRRVIAKTTVENKIAENKLRDKAFARFCGALKEGITVTMFSRKYGTSPSRKISFDDSFNNLTFTTSFGTKGKVELRSIYKIHTGLSETMYAHSRQPLLSRCICLECRSERVVDLELSSAKETREMYQGFERLILLLSGTLSPFFTDNFGIPRRAGPSIIENAINESKTEEDLSKRMFKSKPDEMRFWAAIRTLQNEYDSWQAEQDNERRAFYHAKEVESETLAKRLQTTAHEQMKIDAGAGAAQKVMKLVRFVDPDGTTKMIEVRVDDSGDVDQRSDIGEMPGKKTFKTAKSPPKKSRRYEEEEKSNKWPSIPFIKKKSSKEGENTIMEEQMDRNAYHSDSVLDKKDSENPTRRDDFSVTSSLHSIDTKVSSNNDLLLDPTYISSSGTLRVKRELFVDADEIESQPEPEPEPKQVSDKKVIHESLSSKSTSESPSFWQILFGTSPSVPETVHESKRIHTTTGEDFTRSSSGLQKQKKLVSQQTIDYDDEDNTEEDEDFSHVDEKGNDRDGGHYDNEDDEEEDDDDDEEDDNDDDDEEDDEEDDDEDDDGVSHDADLKIFSEAKGKKSLQNLEPSDACYHEGLEEVEEEDDSDSNDDSEHAIADEGSSDDSSLF